LLSWRFGRHVGVETLRVGRDGEVAIKELGVEELRWTTELLNPIAADISAYRTSSLANRELA
jgi:hypothetical protein